MGPMSTVRVSLPRLGELVRRFNRRWLNPVMLRRAGGRHWYAGFVEHRGRRTGRIRRTPIVAHPVEGGFAVALPYGDRVDWLRNLQASGSGRLRSHGRWYRVDTPRVVPISEVPPGLPTVTRRIAERSAAPWLLLAAHPLDGADPTDATRG